MYILLESKADIQKAQRELEATIREGLSQKEIRNIGWQGGRKVGSRLHTNGRYWFFTEDNYHGTTHRRLNWFGKIEPGTGVAIAVEVNVPYEGSSRMAAGFFARNLKNGRTYLFHSGRVAGGKKGVKKDALVAWAELDIVQVATLNGKSREGIIVMPTSGKGAIRPALDYVQAIIDFKEAVRAGKTQTKSAQSKAEKLRDYYDEFFGRKQGKINKTRVDYESRHGEVVKRLRERRKDQGLKRDLRIVKNRLLDLGVADGEKLIEAYEVKSGCSRGEIYTAIGQLMVHGGASGCTKTLVVPRQNAIPNDITKALEHHRINVQFYRLTSESVEFEN